MLISNSNRFTILAIRAFCALMICMVFLYLVNNYAVYWLEWPGFGQFLSHLFNTGESQLDDAKSTRGLILLLVYAAALIGTTMLVLTKPSRSLQEDADTYSQLAAFVVRASFWSVLFIGLADMIISFLRVEDMLASIVGTELTTQLGRPIFRGLYVHYPLILISILISFRSKTLGFMWLTFLVVLAEFLIVVTRFVFSYEQAFMGDLVRFWYAALFLFASAYTLLSEGHVRVDVLYANFTEKNKARSNIAGSLLLGLPLCWTILTQGMAGKGSSINSPLLSFEISQSGFGMYVKYLMAAFLIVFAVSMAIQFVSVILSCFSVLKNQSSAASR